MEFFHKKTSFRFMATRKVWYTLSAILMVGSFASFFAKGLNFAIDFTGGVLVEVMFPKKVKTEDVRHVVEEAGIKEPVVSLIGSTREVKIELQQDPDAPKGESVDDIMKSFGGKK